MTESIPNTSGTPQKILIIADDLTGAVDTGVQFIKLNLYTVVTTGCESLGKSFRESDVVVVDLESRYDDQVTAYTKAFEAASSSKSLNISHYYKKLDSTMRGNPGAEISGIMDALDINVTFMVPALPLYGRTTINGKVLVNGIPLAETQYSKDPKNPVNESFIPSIISKQTDRIIGVIELGCVRQGKDALQNGIDDLIKKETSIIVIDSETDSDLEMVASVIAIKKGRKLFAGCSGLADKLAPYFISRHKKISNIVLAGSVNKITAMQVKNASEGLNIRIIDINTSRILSKKDNKEKKRILKIVGKTAANGDDLIIRSSSSDETVKNTLEEARKLGLEDFRTSDKIAEFIGDVGAEIIKKYKIRGVLLTGGDTAIKTLEHLKVNSVVINGEIMHGIPYGQFNKKKYRDLIVVTKAGGFGGEDAIIQILKFLRNA
jgi:uncharacterized protein YgbK (DUF1537 family)